MTPDALSTTGSADAGPGPAALERRRARFVALASSRLDRAYRLAGLLLGSSADAEDAVQESLATAWRTLDSLRDEERFGAWLDRILVNRRRDMLRRRRVVRFVPIEGATGFVPDPFATVLEQDVVLRRLVVLGVDERAIVILHYWADLPLEEVARRLDIPVGTVKSRLHRALSRMRAVVPEEALG